MNIKRIAFLMSATLLLVAICSCDKQCHCYKPDGTHKFYTEEEVDEKEDGNCANMKYRAGIKYYDLCEWDY